MRTPNLYINLFKIEKGKPISLPFEIKKPSLQENIAKIIGMIFILSIMAIIIFLSRITGNAIGDKTSNPYLLIPVAIAVIDRFVSWQPPRPASGRS